MIKKSVKIRIRRIYSEEFKKARIAEYESGEFSVLEIARLFSIQSAIIYRWVHRYSVYNKKRVILVEMKDSAKQKLKEYENRISDLERIVGQKQLNIDFLEKMIELAEQEYSVDIKKKVSTPLSPGSGKTNQK